MYRVNKTKLKAAAKKYNLSIIVALDANEQREQNCLQIIVEHENVWRMWRNSTRKRMAADIKDAIEANCPISVEHIYDVEYNLLLHAAREGIPLFAKSSVSFTKFYVLALRLHEDHALRLAKWRGESMQTCEPASQ